MLRITVSKSSSAAKKYYSEPYYSEGKSRDNYYTEKDQVIGTWGGKGAEQLGLNQNIHKDDFASLCDNQFPNSDQKLTERNNTERRVGYDFTFNASKSVSLAYTFASDEDKNKILEAFRDSVKVTMSEIETGMQTRVRQNGQNENRETKNIVYGEFVHFTSRPIEGVPDPHLHSHCFIFNSTYDDQEKKWKAGQFGQINKDAPYYESVFHSTLASNLQSLGYGIDKKENGFEISGVSRETIEKFSRRTLEIENLATEKNITSQEQKAQLGARTRESKRESVSEQEQIKNWNERLTSKEEYELQNLKNNRFADEKKKDELSAAYNSVDFESPLREKISCYRQGNFNYCHSIIYWRGKTRGYKKCI
jgi:conjugative relaxase-like TrwC/TraI family protein